MTRRRHSTHKAVRRDLAHAVQSYSEIDPALAARFVDEYEASFRRIREFPEAHRTLFGANRRVYLPSFRYFIAFRVTDQEVRVLAVLHGKRDPKWLRAQVDGRA